MRRDREYWLRLIRFAVIAFIATLLLTPFLFGAFGMWALTYGPCAEVGYTPAELGYDYEDIIIESREVGGMHRGFYIPSKNGAHIIFPPALHGGRDGRLPEAHILAQHGYGIVTFESRSCMGRVNTLGYREVEDLAGALDWLLSREGVDSARIGVHGFSSAGATAVMGAAQLPALRAVLAEGGYHDLGPGTLGVGGSFPEALARMGAELAYRLSTGISIREVSPVSVIDQIAPRPILLIYGSDEPSVYGAYEQLETAGDNAELWVVEGARHGGYLALAPEEYEQRVVEFFDAALLGE